MDAAEPPRPSGSGGGHQQPDDQQPPQHAGPSSPKGLQITDLLAELGQANPSPLSGSRDLLSLFNLTPLYDTYVRPYLPPNVLNGIAPAAAGESPDTGMKASVKGKERETPVTSIGITIGGVRIGGQQITGVNGGAGDEKPKKQLKMETKYLHMVQDIPGRNVIRKDNNLRDLVLNPDPQPVLIHPLDDQTLREAFSLRPGQIAGFDSHTWESQQPDAGGAKKKKKKRKHDQEAGGPGSSQGVGAGGKGANGGGGGGEEDHRKKKKRKGDGTASTAVSP